MTTTRLLFIEDERESIEPVLNLLARSSDYESEVKCFAQARDALEKMTITPDVIVLDLLEQGTSPEPGAPGLETFKWIWESRFCPIIVYSAQPDLINEEDHPFVKKVKKGRGSPDEVASTLREFAPHVEALHEAEKSIRQEFAFALREVAPYAFDVFPETEPSKRNDMILRAARRRLAALMDDLSRHGQLLASWEQYLYPPVTKDLNLGDILREKGKEGPASFYVVLTPSCDLVASDGRDPKVSSVLTARCCDINEAIQRTSLGKMAPKKLKDRLPSTVLSQGHFETMLPLPALPKRIPHMAANLRDLCLISLDKILQNHGEYERVVSIDSPFRELIAWAYMQVGCRPGLPDRDFETWCNEIIEYCEACRKGENKG